MPERKLYLNESVAAKCRVLVYDAAKSYQIPPVWVTAHIRIPAADKARREVMRSMIVELKLKRWQVAAAFNRDLRRVRKSVLGV